VTSQLTVCQAFEEHWPIGELHHNHVDWSLTAITWNHFDLASAQMLEEDGSWVDSAKLCKSVLFCASHRDHFRW